MILLGGINLRQRNCKGDTVLHYAAEKSKPAMPLWAWQMLLKHNADCNALRFGKSVLELKLDTYFVESQIKEEDKDNYSKIQLMLRNGFNPKLLNKMEYFQMLKLTIRDDLIDRQLLIMWTRRKAKR